MCSANLDFAMPIFEVLQGQHRIPACTRVCDFTSDGLYNLVRWVLFLVTLLILVIQCLSTASGGQEG